MSAEPPRALSALIDVGVALARQAPSSRIVIARAGAAIDPDMLPPRLAAAVAREAELAREVVCVPLAFADVERQLKGAWGRPADQVLDALDPEPLAVTASGQVHRGVLDGTAVAVKVRRTATERQLRTDLALLDLLGPPLASAFPRLNAGAVLRDAREQALDELDLEHEAGQQRRVARALRGIDGVLVPRVHTELAGPEVLVADLAEGETLAAGARPPDPEAAARALAAAFRAAVLDAGLAPTDPRPSHVIVMPDGTLALLGLGVARPVDRDRARRALDGLVALGADDAEAFAAAASADDVLDAQAARDAAPLLRAVAGPLVASDPVTLDATLLRDLLARAYDAAPELARLAARTAPEPQDLALARMLAQLVAVMARLGATARWTELLTG